MFFIHENFDFDNEKDELLNDIFFKLQIFKGKTVLNL